jgi:hypothetical protein
MVFAPEEQAEEREESEKRQHLPREMDRFRQRDAGDPGSSEVDEGHRAVLRVKVFTDRSHAVRWSSRPAG